MKFIYFLFLASCATPVIEPVAKPVATPKPAHIYSAPVTEHVVGPRCLGDDVFIYSGGTFVEDNDTVVMARAKVRCVDFYPQSPCVRSITKTPGPHYAVICGKEAT